jgi:hypothetical protein
MTAMLFIALFVAVAVLSSLLGLSLGWLSARHRRSSTSDEAPAPPLDPAVEQAIQSAAERWAADRGRPWLAPLIADKLRLAYRLREGRAGR